MNVKVAGSCHGVSFTLDPDDLEGAEYTSSMGDISWMVRDFRTGSGRSLCVTAPGPVELEMTFDVTRYESHGGGSATGDELKESLEPDRMIPLDRKVAAMAASLPTNPDAVATGRALYDHTLERMKYDKPEGGEWGRGDAEWACDSRYGNCTDFHSYFMGLARTKGIPARFEMGFSVPGGDGAEKEIGGYHCWAFFWSEQEAKWIPVDISEADKHPEKAEYFFGTLDYDRVTMSERARHPAGAGAVDEDAELLRVSVRGDRRGAGDEGLQGVQAGAALSPSVRSIAFGRSSLAKPVPPEGGTTNRTA